MAASMNVADSENGECACVLESLRVQGLSSRSYEQKKEIISRGRPMPDLPNLKTKTKRCVRHFSAEQYGRIGWLCGCRKLSKLYCWPCVLFSNEKGVWSSSGFDDMNNLLKATQRHQQSQIHIRSEILLTTFGSSRIDLQLDQQRKLEIFIHNELVKSNRKVIRRFIDVVIFLSRQELPFGGQERDENSANRGNFIELVTLLSKYDDTLDSHLQKATVLTGLSHHVQNDLIDGVAIVLANEIKKEILQSPFVAIIVDETTNISSHSQLSTTMRYMSADGEIQERFLGFTNMSADRSANALTEHVFRVLNDYDCGSKLVSQCYDGAVVLSGELNCLQKKVKDKYPYALFVHCSAHALNLVLSQSTTSIKECQIFFMTLSSFASFFSHSTKRNAALERVVQKRFPKICLTRWNYNERFVETMRENKENLISLFENILENPNEWDNDTYHEARGLNSVLAEFNFNFLLHVFSDIFCMTDALFSILQTKMFDVTYCIKKVNETKEFFWKKRFEFDLVWHTCEQSCGLPKKRRRVSDDCDVRTSYHRLYYEIYDNIYNQLEIRFEALDKLKFLQLLDGNNVKKQFPEEALCSLRESYGQHFDFARLRSELCVAYSTEDYLPMGIPKLLHYLKNTGLSSTAFTELFKLCALVSTIPVSSSSDERSFSVLRRIHTYCKNTRGQNIHSNLSFLSIEKKLLKLKFYESEDKFYNLVIDEFSKKERRIDLQFKYAT